MCLRRNHLLPLWIDANYIAALISVALHCYVMLEECEGDSLSVASMKPNKAASVRDYFKQILSNQRKVNVHLSWDAFKIHFENMVEITASLKFTTSKAMS